VIDLTNGVEAAVEAPKDAAAVIAEALVEMRALARDKDYETAHSYADGLLCDVLKKLGAGELVDAWHQVGKWYA
jgi:hypothetical protein